MIRCNVVLGAILGAMLFPSLVQAQAVQRRRHLGEMPGRGEGRQGRQERTSAWGTMSHASL